MRARRMWLLLPLLAIPFLALLGYGLTRDPFVIPSPLAGTRAPDFRLATLEGDSLGLADLRETVVVLNFWASWCVPCRYEHPALLRASREYEPNRARVVGVVYQDTPENARRFLDRFGGGWTSVLDPGSRVAIDFGVYGVPETFFIGRDGRIARKHIGPVDWETIRATVDSLLAAPGASGVADAPTDGEPARHSGRGSEESP